MIIDGFAGGGGASLGIAWAIGRAPDVAINHDADAIEMHAANHPDTLHVIDDVWKADMKRIVRGRKVGLVWVSPDCFGAGTLVLAKRGLVPIEEMQIGDEVLTHKNRWRKVTGLIQKDSETIRLKGHGHYGLDVTPDHQIYSQYFAWRDKKQGDEVTKSRCTNGIRWIEAKDMVGSTVCHWATPHSVPAVAMTPPPAEMSEEFFYFLGRWVACGSFSKSDIVISCGYHDARATHERLVQAGLKDTAGKPFFVRCRELPETMQVIIGSVELQEWIESNFGRLSKEKHLPIWMLGLQRNWREAFLAGYCDGDGYTKDGVTAISTVSKSLALSIKLLVTSLGKAASFHYSFQKDSLIGDRVLKGGPCYRIVWRSTAAVQQFVDDGKHRFTAVKKILPGVRQTVYCIEVDEDSSFVADGIIVHNCKHFSRAKGAKPVEKNIRSLAWVAVRWAEQLKPNVIMLENVREFEDWGPLVPVFQCSQCDWRGTEGQAKLARTRRRCPRCESLRLKQTSDSLPDPDRKGLTFRRFTGRLRNLGYEVQWRNLDAADYGAPTHRRRLFLVARRDGRPIHWPEPTHGDPRTIDDQPLFDRLKPWRTAAECIDWSIPCPSIFDRKRPLKEATLRRIAFGIKRYVIDADCPFLVPNQTRNAAATLVQTGYGERDGQLPRCLDMRMPVGTVVAGGCKIGVVSAFIAKHFGNMVGCEVETPLPTTTSKGCQNQLVTANLIRFNYTEAGGDPKRPLPTATACIHAGLVYAFLVKYFGTAIGHALSDPLSTITSKDRFGLVTVSIGGEPYAIVDIGMRMLTPRELARAQGFPDTYELTGTKTSQVARIGNSVCPHVAAALVAANLTKESSK